ncbi:hypothetical protein [Microcoleus sp. CAWBG58]|nr:hypothetical protein [Microcoleus sp. CAWBG58]
MLHSLSTVNCQLSSAKQLPPIATPGRRHIPARFSQATHPTAKIF